MPYKRKRQNDSRSYPDSGTSIACPPRKLSVTIEQPFTIRQEPAAETDEHYREEKNYRDATLRTAQRLNRITVVGIVFTLLGLGAVFLNYRQSAQALRIDQRAWLGITMVKSEPQGTQGTAAVAKLINSGKTPALSVGTIQTIDEHSGILPMEQVNDAVYHGNFVAMGPIAPGVTHNMGYGRFRDEPQVGGETFARFHGKVVYDDIFHQHHWMTFCYLMETHPAPEPQGWRACQYDNETD